MQSNLRSKSGGNSAQRPISQRSNSSGSFDMMTNQSFASCADTHKTVAEEMNLKAGEHIQFLRDQLDKEYNDTT